MIPRHYLNARILLPTASGQIIGISNLARPYCLVRLDKPRRTVRLWEGDLGRATIITKPMAQLSLKL